MTAVATPLLSVLVPCFRSAGFVARAVESALGQTLGDLEVVVVDNASDDGTDEVLSDLARRDARVRVARNPENLGPVRNWRRCVELARGRYAALLFSDDWYEPTFAAETLPFLRDPAVGLVYTAVRMRDETGAGDDRAVYYAAAGEPVRSSDEFVRSAFESVGQLVPVSPGCAVMRREDLAAWLRAELPGDATFGFLAHGAGPDLLVYLLACAAYPRLAHVSRPLVNFRRHAANLSGDPNVGMAYLAALSHFLESRRPRALALGRARARLWWAARASSKRPAMELHVGPASWPHLAAFFAASAWKGPRASAGLGPGSGSSH